MARVQGVFGCFVAGRAALEQVDADGQSIERFELGEVTPLETLRVDETLPLHDKASALRLNILDEAGEYAGALDRLDVNAL